MGSLVFLRHGWRAGAGLSVGFAGCMLIILLVRGPHTQRHTWFGYEGGMRWGKEEPKEKAPELEASTQPSSDASCIETRLDDGQVVEATPSNDDEKTRPQESGGSMV